MLSSYFATVSTSGSAALPPLAVHTNPSLALSPHCTGGLILSGRFFNDLVWPGASLATPDSFACQTIYVIGQVKYSRTTSMAAWQFAKTQRIQSIQILERIVAESSAVKRANQLYSFLCRRFGLESVQTVPLDEIARLIAVSVDEVEAARTRYLNYLSQQASQQRISQPNFLSWQRQLYRRQSATNP
ncbi:MAG: hypothetical protein ACTS2F_04670 [Thainema sp.]